MGFISSKQLNLPDNGNNFSSDSTNAIHENGLQIEETPRGSYISARTRRQKPTHHLKTKN